MATRYTHPAGLPTTSENQRQARSPGEVPECLAEALSDLAPHAGPRRAMPCVCSRSLPSFKIHFQTARRASQGDKPPAPGSQPAQHCSRGAGDPAKGDLSSSEGAAEGPSLPPSPPPSTASVVPRGPSW